MNKVLQAAGRVIRTTEDRGVILLLDERFLQRDYEPLYPREWADRRVCGADDVEELVQSFWKNADEK
jgi:Rad3-related DNA helicase